MYKLICDVGASVSVDSLPPVGETDTLYRLTKPNYIQTKHPVLVESLYTYEDGEFKYHCDRLIYTNTRADVIDSPVYYEEGMELNEDVLYMIDKVYTDEQTGEATKTIELNVAVDGQLEFVNNVTQYPDEPSPEEVIVNNITAEVENDTATLTIDGLGFTDETEVIWDIQYDTSTPVQSLGTGITYDVDASAGSAWDNADTVTVSVMVGDYRSASYVVKTPTISVNNIEALINGNLVTLIAEGKAIGESTNIDWHISYDDSEPTVISSTGTSLVLDDPNTTSFFHAADVTVFVTIDTYTSDTFNVRHVIEISNIAAAEYEGNVTFTMSCRNIPDDAEINWVVYYDEGDGVALSGVGYSLALDPTNVEAYDNADTVGVQASYDNYTSEIFTVKEPVPEPVSVTDVTATEDEGTIRFDMVSTGIPEDAEVSWEVSYDGESVISIPDIGYSTVLDSENRDAYLAASTVTVRVVYEEYISEEFTVKEPAPEPVEVTDVTATEEGDVIFTMTSTGIPEDAEVSWEVSYNGEPVVSIPGVGYSVTLDEENKDAYDAASTVTVRVVYEEYISEEFTVKEPVPEPISVENITATLDAEEVSFELTGTGISEETVCTYTMKCDDSDDVVFEGVGTTVVLDNEKSQEYISATNVDVTVSIDDYTSDTFRVKSGENPEA